MDFTEVLSLHLAKRSDGLDLLSSGNPAMGKTTSSSASLALSLYLKSTTECSTEAVMLCSCDFFLASAF